jgi:hypothetical protein
MMQGRQKATGMHAPFRRTFFLRLMSVSSEAALSQILTLCGISRTALARMRLLFSGICAEDGHERLVY